MINLLLPSTKKELRAARLNAVLLNYCYLILLIILVTTSILGIGFFLTWQERTVADDMNAKNQQSVLAYSGTKKAAEDFRSDLKQAKLILGNQISMFDLITRIAALMPPGVILSNLSLGTTSFNTPLAVSAKAQNYAAAIQLKDNLIKSHIFDSVSIINTTTNVVLDPRQDPIGAAYPIAINMSAQFSNQFINSTPGAKQ